MGAAGAADTEFRDFVSRIRMRPFHPIGIRRGLALLVLTCLCTGAMVTPAAGRGASTSAHAQASAAARARVRISRADVRASLVGVFRWPGRPFAPTSFWNAHLSRHPAIARRSRAYVAELAAQVHNFDPWLNSSSYGVPVYVVGAHVFKVRVKLDTWAPDLQRAFDAVPIPERARSAAGSDAQLTVWQPSRNRLWEFWQLRQIGGRWTARWGGEMNDVSRNPGYFTHSGLTNDWGATATGLPLLGGLITFQDLERGYIDHALALSLVETEPEYWSWPAQRTDGGIFDKERAEIPEGMRFRLNPGLDVNALHLPPLDRMLALAAQRYGIVVRDKSGAVTFYGQDPVGIADPWPDAFENEYPNNVLDLFPWKDLEALRPRLSCCWGPPHP
jgi:hypothetical protein